MKVTSAEVQYIATSDEGRIHRGLRVAGVLYTAEPDNLDQADREEISRAEAEARHIAGAPLCERCLPSGELDEADSFELSHTADADRAGEP